MEAEVELLGLTTSAVDRAVTQDLPVNLLAQRLLAVATHLPVSRRRLEVLAARQGPLVYDGLASQRAVRALVRAGLLIHSGATVPPKFVITLAGEKFLDELYP